MIKEKDSELVLRSALHTTARNIENLTPPDAENQLRAMMMEVAISVSKTHYMDDTTFITQKKLNHIVNETLNGK